MNKRKQSKGNFANWDSTLKHLIKFAGTKVSFREIDQNFCENFRDFLINTAKKTSIRVVARAILAPVAPPNSAPNFIKQCFIMHGRTSDEDITCRAIWNALLYYAFNALSHALPHPTIRPIRGDFGGSLSLQNSYTGHCTRHPWYRW